MKADIEKCYFVEILELQPRCLGGKVLLVTERLVIRSSNTLQRESKERYDDKYDKKVRNNFNGK